MKNDVLTITALVFVIGVLVTGVFSSEWFEDEPEVPTALLQGVATR
ncbi:hypothetical protein [Simiduia agarivorans]|uniref:Uncharacterized protein n=1 Tax=Simiduia agarivorans (strain DSM 21679 / JCM 13881 / BCRC 17597 / SA1) TaxID=1117647 RepID=R9S5V3_SIMAS|nr:hypothetical protein [Simiduia agarivorans]AGN11364.1 hypothetical protein M5M_14137 [Simiduia agarivorans SA1 = DSM 21679]